MKDFKNPKVIGILAVGLLAIWHLAMALTSKLNLTGPLMVKPDAGYTWTGIDNAESRFFWQDTDIKWEKGTEHPDYNAITSEDEGVWKPAPGYVFINKKKSLETKWKAGTRHPKYMATAGEEEDQWIPVVGYRFVYDGDDVTGTVWEPHRRYDALKISSGQTQDTYEPFPGYEFVAPNQNLNVVWMPGILHSENPKLIAGVREGSWEAKPANIRYVTSTPTRRRSQLTPGQAFGLGVAVGVVGGATIPRRLW